MIGAFFDMDNTLLSASSGQLYLRFLRARGYLTYADWARIAAWSGLYLSGLLGFPAVMARVMVLAAGASETEAWRLSAEWYEAVLQRYITPAGRERVAWHRAQGHRVAIISASTPFAVRPVAASLGLAEDYVATQLEVVDGRLTGRLAGQACYDEGKLELTRQYAERQGIELSLSYFYGDSHHDLPLLQVVGRPVAVNPNRRLARIAAGRGWPVMRFY